jgi:hypothetical protein
MCKTVHTANQISPQYVVWQRKQRIDYMRVNTCCLKNHRYESPKQALKTDSTASCRGKRDLPRVQLALDLIGGGTFLSRLEPGDSKSRD